jgi:hypothetical protein
MPVLCGAFTAPSAGDDSCSWHAYFRRGAQHGAEARRSPRRRFANIVAVAGARLDLVHRHRPARADAARSPGHADRSPLSAPTTATSGVVDHGRKERGFARYNGKPQSAGEKLKVLILYVTDPNSPFLDLFH